MYAGSGLIRGLRVNRCAAALGGAIYMEAPPDVTPPHLTIRESSLSELSAVVRGGAIFLSCKATATIEVKSYLATLCTCCGL